MNGCPECGSAGPNIRHLLDADAHPCDNPWHDPPKGRAGASWPAPSSEKAEAERDEWRAAHARALRDREAVEAEMDRRLGEAWAERDNWAERWRAGDACAAATERQLHEAEAAVVEARAAAKGWEDAAAQWRDRCDRARSALRYLRDDLTRADWDFDMYPPEIRSAIATVAADPPPAHIEAAVVEARNMRFERDHAHREVADLLAVVGGVRAAVGDDDCPCGYEVGEDGCDCTVCRVRAALRFVATDRAAKAEEAELEARNLRAERDAAHREVADLLAVVGGVRALRERYFDEHGDIAGEDGWRFHRDLLAVLDGEPS